MALIATPDGAVREFPNARTLRGKTFDMGARRRKIVSGIRVVHVPQDVPAWELGVATPLEDIDPSVVWDASAERFRMVRGWFDVEFRPDELSLSYTSKRGGGVTMRLERVDGDLLSTRSPVFKPELIANGVRFPDVIPDMDVWFECTPQGVRIFRKLKSPVAPKAFEWDADLRPGVTFEVGTRLDGWDNDDDADPIRAVEDLPVRRYRSLQMTGESTVIDGRRKLIDAWTGKTIEIDPVTKTQTLRDDVIYPVVIDPDITESVGADNDDGTDSVSANTWDASIDDYYGSRAYWLASSTSRLQPGWRFQTVAIPAGATIDLANLIIEVNKVQSTGVTATIFGYDVDSSAAWSNTIRPEVMAATTASASQAMTTTGVKTVNVTTIIAEIAARAGWASGGNISLAVIGGSGDESAWVDDIGCTRNTAAVLEIDYTEGGGGDPEGSFLRGKLLRGGLLLNGGVLVRC